MKVKCWPWNHCWHWPGYETARPREDCQHEEKKVLEYYFKVKCCKCSKVKEISCGLY